MIISSFPSPQLLNPSSEFCFTLFCFDDCTCFKFSIRFYFISSVPLMKPSTFLKFIFICFHFFEFLTTAQQGQKSWFLTWPFLTPLSWVKRQKHFITSWREWKFSSLLVFFWSGWRLGLQIFLCCLVRAEQLFSKSFLPFQALPLLFLYLEWTGFHLFVGLCFFLSFVYFRWLASSAP